MPRLSVDPEMEGPSPRPPAHLAELEAQLAKPPVFFYNPDGSKTPQDRDLMRKVLADLKAERDTQPQS